MRPIQEAIDKFGDGYRDGTRIQESPLLLEEMTRGLDRLLGVSDRRELTLNPEQAKEIGWNGWDDPLKIAIERKRSFRGLSIDNGAYGEVLTLDGNSVELLSFQIYEGKSTTPVPLLSSEEGDSNFIPEWNGYIDRLRMVVGEALTE